jgi:hypothetical protein
MAKEEEEFKAEEERLDGQMQKLREQHASLVKTQGLRTKANQDLRVALESSVAALGPQGCATEELDAAMEAEASDQAISEAFSKTWLQQHGADLLPKEALLAIVAQALKLSGKVSVPRKTAIEVVMDTSPIPTVGQKRDSAAADLPDKDQ